MMAKRPREQDLDAAGRAELQRRVPKFFRDRQFILDATGEPVHEPDFLAYLDWWSTHTPLTPPVRVGFDIVGDTEISTVFLMCPMPLIYPYAAPGYLFFETMVSGGLLEFHRWRTRQDAEMGHQTLVRLIRRRIER